MSYEQRVSVQKVGPKAYEPMFAIRNGFERIA